MKRYLCAALILMMGTAAAELQNVEVGGKVNIQFSEDYPPTLPALHDPLNLSDGTMTTGEDRTDLAVTIYNNNRALVREQRSIKLMPGEVDLKFMDVPELIMPETVSLKSLNDAASLRILEQNYEYDLMSPEKMMEKYIGKDLRLIQKSEEGHYAEVEAKLLSMNNGPVYQIGEDIYLSHPGNVVLPKVPADLIAKPTLIWKLMNGGTDHTVEATYLTGGLSWRADYVVQYDEKANSLDLEGWVTLTNQSGAYYRDAQLKLVAGEVNVVQENRMYKSMARGAPMAEMAIADMGMQEESFAEYHLYTLPRRTTIKNNQTKQVSLLSGKNAAVKKIYEYRGQTHYYASRMPQFEPEKVSAYLTFKNEEENQLGMPLPAGIMRVYQEDSSGALQFSGEDRIKHTPKDEEIRLKLGKAFDIVAERKQMNYQPLANNLHESTFEITIRNHKEQAVTVDVVEPFSGKWRVTASSHKHVKKDAFTGVFSLDVPADGETVLEYTVRIEY